MPRYIDVEKLLNELQQRYESALSWYENVSDPDLKTRAEQAVASFLESILTIKNQATADVQEVKHAHWIDSDWYGNSKCPCCGYEDAVPEFWNWCPCCGAKMDGKDE